MSTGYVPNPANLNIQPVKLMGNQQDDDFQTGRTKPTLITCESPQSISLVIDGKYRTAHMNPFAFRVSISNNLFRARMVRVSKVVVPKPPNVTPFNNVLRFRQWDGVAVSDLSVTLQPAFYNTTSLANELAAAMTTTAGGLNVYVCAFDPITRTFTISYTNNGVPRPFFIANTSTFTTRGEFLAPFPSKDPSLDPLVDGSTSIASGIAGMLYTRYAIISSESFNQYSFSDSRTTTPFLQNNIICIVDMTSVYTSDDFDVGTPYSGVFATVSTPDAPHIMVTNPQKNLNDKIDIFVQDEYGESFQDVMNLGVGFPQNTIGISLWMEVTF